MYGHRQCAESVQAAWAHDHGESSIDGAAGYVPALEFLPSLYIIILDMSRKRLKKVRCIYSSFTH